MFNRSHSSSFLALLAIAASPPGGDAAGSAGAVVFSGSSPRPKEVAETRKARRPKKEGNEESK